jgi:hypothetical protein
LGGPPKRQKLTSVLQIKRKIASIGAIGILMMPFVSKNSAKFLPAVFSGGRIPKKFQLNRANQPAGFQDSQGLKQIGAKSILRMFPRLISSDPRRALASQDTFRILKVRFFHLLSNRRGMLPNLPHQKAEEFKIPPDDLIIY